MLSTNRCEQNTSADEFRETSTSARKVRTLAAMTFYHYPQDVGVVRVVNSPMSQSRQTRRHSDALRGDEDYADSVKTPEVAPLSVSCMK